MRLFHVSEEPGIQVFHPRPPTRPDLDPGVGLVWAIDWQRLPNFITPRNCPRVTYHAGPRTTQEDRQQFFSSPEVCHGVVIEHGWFEAMRNTILYVYEFAPEEFVLQDPAAGYYVATTTQRPIACRQVKDLLGELVSRGVELRVTASLWQLAEQVQASTLVWSLCRMGYARPKSENSK